MTKARVYLVAVKETEGTVSHLVKAVTANQAVNFIAKPKIIASIPTQEELVSLGAKGVKIEDATKE